MGCEFDRKRKSSSGCESGKKINKVKSSSTRVDNGVDSKLQKELLNAIIPDDDKLIDDTRIDPVESGKKIKKVKSSSTRVDNGVDSKLQKELWNAIIPCDEKLIDDTRIDPADHYQSDNERSVSVKAKEEVDDEVERIFKGFGRRKKNPEKSTEELGMFVEHRMAEFELADESDAELNLDNKPAINKLDKLPLLMDVLSKKPLQLEFSDRGVLTLLKNWLEPLLDGSLPNITVRSGVLKILLPPLSCSCQDLMKRQRVIESLPRTWLINGVRPIFNKSTRFEDTRKYLDDDKVLYRKPPVKRITHKTAMLDFKDTDDLDEFKRERKSCELSSSKQHASKPEAALLDFMIRARAKLVEHDKCRVQIHKKLRQLKAPKKKLLQASKLSAEGRDMFKFF
ncbi:hypothetical protein MKW98_023808 [Papaver atlanticum]|uniref:TFIIS N-terminal domain-containing protein n=1 Tax=Papaver atlanticum TaxID=357466 RepID=A0AAD4XP28_9MAGN|nr:hypothetical protein MKW98_023808 [Papaver atlanticum]